MWGVVEEGRSLRSPVAKFLSEDEIGRALDALGASEGDVVLIVADRAEVAARVLGALRLEVAGPAPDGVHDVLWVVDFPMFEWDDEAGRFDPLHHPFTAPTGDLDGDPGTWRSRAYDVVLDGWELGGGSIRINTPEVQQKVFDALGIGPDEAQRALRVPARGAALRGAAARRDRVRARSDRDPAGRPRLHPRRDRLPQDGQRQRPSDGSPGARSIPSS